MRRGVSVGSRCLGGSTQARAAQPKLGICLSSRAAVRQPTPLQASRGQFLFSTSAPRPRSPAAEGPKARGRRRAKLPAVATAVGALCAIAAAAAWYSAGAGGDGSLNETKFTPFDIVAREQVSPTAFLLTVRSPAGPAAAANAAKVQAAWDHGLWSVEVKQPQLQIARHYTPLPPLAGEGAAATTPTAQLRFLVRRMPTGEMSNYLARLEVGDQLWLRGPHYGFDVARRLGSADDVVFLAGGTGVAPALQLAHKLLGAPGHTTTAGGPSLRILWANRQGVDAVAREPLPGATAGPDTIPGQSVLLRQLAEMRRAYGDRLRIDYFVDEEKSFVGLKDVDAALGRPLAWRSRPALPPADRNCVWHSAALLALSADEEDRLRGNDDAACTCGPPAGRKIACVSGPDGFIEAYAGAKRWHAGRELQGPVQGVIGTVKRQSSGAMGDWLVLKL